MRNTAIFIFADNTAILATYKNLSKAAKTRPNQMGN